MTNLKEMYLELREPIYRYLLNLSGGNTYLAEDLTQETFYRAILALPRFRKVSSVKTWLYSIARNIYLRKIRDEVKQKTTFLDDKISHAAELWEDPQSCLEKAERDKAAFRALYGAAGNLPHGGSITS